MPEAYEADKVTVIHTSDLLLRYRCLVTMVGIRYFRFLKFIKDSQGNSDVGGGRVLRIKNDSRVVWDDHGPTIGWRKKIEGRRLCWRHKRCR